MPQYLSDEKPTYIGSGNGLVPSDNKPLPEPMLTKICGAIWCHYAMMSQHNAACNKQISCYDYCIAVAPFTNMV